MKPGSLLFSPLFLFTFSFLLDIGIATRPSRASFLAIASARELKNINWKIKMPSNSIPPATSPFASPAQHFLHSLYWFWLLAALFDFHSFGFVSSIHITHLTTTFGASLLNCRAGGSRLLNLHHPWSPIVDRPDSNKVDALPERDPDTEPWYSGGFKRQQRGKKNGETCHVFFFLTAGPKIFDQWVAMRRATSVLQW